MSLSTVLRTIVFLVITSTSLTIESSLGISLITQPKCHKTLGMSMLKITTPNLGHLEGGFRDK